ncbi:hypothetical protein AVEN_195370-1 [Araneus ventricosus]|uniref:Uncharacterized protein n=1 Tax=Araneus ventricosus TaxID=182803 RepID=A0A4Y2DJB2_ARAVE|nr:hypothetical protein AVEN_195370-1 [Araneus ventricosus]
MPSLKDISRTTDVFQCKNPIRNGVVRGKVWIFIIVRFPFGALGHKTGKSQQSGGNLESRVFDILPIIRDVRRSVSCYIRLGQMGTFSVRKLGKSVDGFLSKDSGIVLFI